MISTTSMGLKLMTPKSRVASLLPGPAWHPICEIFMLFYLNFVKISISPE